MSMAGQVRTCLVPVTESGAVVSVHFLVHVDKMLLAKAQR